MASSGIAINGEKLRKVRMARRLSTKNLADLIACSPGHIRLMERELRKPSIALLGKLEHHLGISAIDLDANIPV